MTKIAKELIIFWVVINVFDTVAALVIETYFDWLWFNDMSAYDVGVGMIIAYWLTDVRNLAMINDSTTKEEV